MTESHLVDAPLARFYGLTERHVEILTLVAAGKTNAQIGRALFLSEDTVKGHLKRLFERLQVDDRAAAIATAYDVGVFRTRAQRAVLAEIADRRRRAAA